MRKPQRSTVIFWLCITLLLGLLISVRWKDFSSPPPSQWTSNESPVSPTKPPAIKDVKRVTVAPADTDWTFPEGFLWGAALSAFQNEGGAGRTDWDVWPTYSEHPAFHPGLTDEDIVRAGKLGITSLRYSIEWARVETTQNHFDREAIGHYVQQARVMRKNGIEPFINLNHFSLPRWVAECGGWENDSIVAWFAAYTEQIARAFRPLRIHWWMTFNEPTVIISEGYLNGNFPPQRKNALSAIHRVSRNLIHAHREAYDELHRILDRPRNPISVGIANYDPFLTPYDPHDGMDTLVTGFLDLAGPHAFLLAIDDRLDYIGINYYGRSFIRFSAFGGIFRGSPVEFMKPYRISENPEISMDPEGLYRAVLRYRVYQKPLLITENGIDDGADRYRPRYLVEHLQWLHRAVIEAREHGDSPILGYFHWTLMDNAEWGSLNKPTHFGLIAVDSRDSVRSERPSALLYRDIIRENGLTPVMVRQYGNTKRRE